MGLGLLPKSEGNCYFQRSEVGPEPDGPRGSWEEAGVGDEPGLCYLLAVWPQADCWTSLNYSVLICTVESH